MSDALTEQAIRYPDAACTWERERGIARTEIDGMVYVQAVDFGKLCARMDYDKRTREAEINRQRMAQHTADAHG